MLTDDDLEVTKEMVEEAYKRWQMYESKDREYVFSTAQLLKKEYESLRKLFTED